MPPFRFRADVVLRLRHKQDEAAQRALALACADRQAADLACADARARLDDGLHRAARAEASPHDAHTRAWHRNWIIRLRRDADASRATLDDRRRVAEAARRTAIEARRDLRAMEKLRERASKAHERSARIAEQKALDLLATLQHATRAADRKETA
jgi:flagellar export protein FliJ